MKAERRHELQENTLANVLQNFPLYLSIYGGRILTVLLVISLAVLLLRYRSNAKQQTLETTRVNLASAREATRQLNRLVGGFRPPTEIAQLRSQLIADADAALEAAVANADTPTVKSEAIVSRGDLFWTAANLPELPGASTQPALALPQPRNDLLTRAESAYRQVLSDHSGEPMAVGAALMGLAAIAENRGQFDDATKLYEQLKQSNAPDLYKRLADGRVAQLPVIRVQRRVVAATQASLETVTPTSLQTTPVEATTQPVEATTQPG